MPKGKKNKASPPRAKDMTRTARMQSAHIWLKKYTGKNIVSGYRKHFGVDWICAFTELETLGIHIDPDYKQKVLKSVDEQRMARERKKKAKEESKVELFDQDENFAYIAGYTSGGAPFGTQRDELKNERDVKEIDR